MKKYEKQLRDHLKKAQKIALAGLGFAVVAQRKLERLARRFVGKNSAKAKAKAKTLISEAVKEQGIAQKKLKEETNKAFLVVMKESQKKLSKFQNKLEKNKPSKKKKTAKKR
ncbi:MAG: hypothetical protein V1914_03460 [archaeon]